MPDHPFILELIGRGLFPLLAVAALAGFWAMGVFRRGYLRQGPGRRLRLTGVVWVICLMAAMLHPVLSVIAIFLGTPPPPANAEGPASPSTFEMIRQLSPLLTPAMLIALAFAWPDGARRLGLARPGVAGQWGLGALLAIPAAIIAFGANTLAGSVGLLIGDPAPEVGHRLLIEMLEDATPAKIAAVVVMAVLYAPLIEELGYRGFAQTVLGDRFGRAGRWATVVIVGVIFALMHLPAVTWHAIPGLAALGIVWGAAYERTGSIWVPIAAHATFNAINIALVLVLVQVGVMG